MRKLPCMMATLVLVPSTALGQGTLGPISLSASAGIEAAHARDNTTWTPGFSMQAAATLQPPGQAWAIRVSGWFFDRQRQEGAFQSRAQAAGLGLEGRYDLLRGRTVPYVYAGAGSGWFYTVVNSSVRRDRGSAFVSGGFGVERRVGRASLFGELRLVHPLRGEGFGSYFAPVTFGVRF